MRRNLRRAQNEPVTGLHSHDGDVRSDIRLAPEWHRLLRGESLDAATTYVTDTGSADGHTRNMSPYNVQHRYGGAGFRNVATDVRTEDLVRCQTRSQFESFSSPKNGGGLSQTCSIGVRGSRRVKDATQRPTGGVVHCLGIAQAKGNAEQLCFIVDGAHCARAGSNQTRAVADKWF